MTQTVIYLAHPLRAEHPNQIQRNRLQAKIYGVTLSSLGLVVTLDWAWLSELWTEQEGRTLGLLLDCHHLQTCTDLVLTGYRISQGMALERDFATASGLKVHDWTGLPYEAAYKQARDMIDLGLWSSVGVRMQTPPDWEKLRHLPHHEGE